MFIFDHSLVDKAYSFLCQLFPRMWHPIGGNFS